MRAAWYEKQGPAREVLTVGEMPEPTPAAGEVRIRIAASGINPGDIQEYSRVLPGERQLPERGKGIGRPGLE